MWWLLTPLFMVVGHRMIPFFSASALPKYEAFRPDWALRLLLAVSVIHGALAMADLARLAWPVDLAGAACALWLSWKWQLRRSLAVPILAMLHLGFAWLGIACLPERVKGGAFMQPTIITDVQEHYSCQAQEIFGPVVTITPFDREEDVIARANATEYGLSATVWTSDLRRGHRVAAAIDAGDDQHDAFAKARGDAARQGQRQHGPHRPDDAPQVAQEMPRTGVDAPPEAAVARLVAHAQYFALAGSTQRTPPRGSGVSPA